jgi:hypothetical protein
LSHRDRPLPGTAISRAILAAFCASRIGIGLARLAYTSLLPAIIDAHWFEPSAAASPGRRTWRAISLLRC